MDATRQVTGKTAGDEVKLHWQTRQLQQQKIRPTIAAVEAAICERLALAGYRRHHRGEWRRRRGAAAGVIAWRPLGVVSGKQQQTRSWPWPGRVTRWLWLPSGRAGTPTAGRFGRHIGNNAGQAERALVRAIAGDNELVDEAIVRKLNALRVDLAGAEADAPGAVCWCRAS